MKKYQHFGVMLDCSRNAVMKPSAVKKMMDCLAKMGYNTLELYMEDVYEVDGEPFFGYLRGRYTSAEIKDMDDYARSLGIELIPCIQTLAHFTNPMKLSRFHEIRDVDDILLIDEDKTYEFIDRLFCAVAKCFTSRNVHIGMDEAHMVGLGKYLDKHGFTDRQELLCRHLGRVVTIARKYGFVPHMWSDMFFRLSLGGGYYGRDFSIPLEVRARVPSDIGLVYWDYYHDDVADYDAMFVAHKEFGREIWFGGGAWSWNGFAPHSTYALDSMQAAMKSVCKHDIDNVIITLWGDDGKECSFFALLPVLYAIRRFADGETDREKIAHEFEALFELSYDDFMALELPNRTEREANFIENPCKSLLYNDCFTGFLDANVEKRKHIPYGEYAVKLADCVKRAGEYGYIFDAMSKLCAVLEIKAELGVRTRKAYLAADKKALAQIAKEYEKAIERLKVFYTAFKTLWNKENKPFGFEVQDARLGGLMLRIASCKERIELYCSGKIQAIEELEQNILEWENGRLQHNEYVTNITTSKL